MVTVLVFFAAHVYAGTLARLAATDGKAGLPESLRGAVHHSLGMLLISLAPIAVLLLGVTTSRRRRLRDLARAHRSTRWPSESSAGSPWRSGRATSGCAWPAPCSTAAFGGILILLKALIHH